ncbi:MAG: hypothetical protein GY869_26540, partial [Planctomycetes bacterium]|nr:hypothetical protein [Planctomycetota bacterium]
MISVINNWRERWYLKWLWVRYSYRFNWAHKPLCERFRGDYVKIGGVCLCRSCALVYLALFLGGMFGLVFQKALREVGVAAFVGCSTVTLVFSYPGWYKRWPRLVRDGLRFMLGISVALCGYLLFYGNPVVGAAGGLMLFGLWKVYMRLRNRRKGHACEGCGDLKKKTVCPGYAWQAEYLRQYEQKATEYIVGRGYLPQIVDK